MRPSVSTAIPVNIASFAYSEIVDQNDQLSRAPIPFCKKKQNKTSRRISNKCIRFVVNSFCSQLRWRSASACRRKPSQSVQAHRRSPLAELYSSQPRPWGWRRALPSPGGRAAIWGAIPGRLYQRFGPLYCASRHSIERTDSYQRHRFGLFGIGKDIRSYCCSRQQHSAGDRRFIRRQFIVECASDHDGDAQSAGCRYRHRNDFRFRFPGRSARIRQLRFTEHDPVCTGHGLGRNDHRHIIRAPRLPAHSA